MGTHALQYVELPNRILVARLRRFLGAPQAALYRVEVRKAELCIDDVNVRKRIDAARDVHHVVVDEAAHHVRDCVGLADVRQELVAEPLALRCAGDQPGDVDEFNRGREDLLRFRDRGKLRQPQVRHRHHADVRVDGAEGIVRGRSVLRLRHRVEQRRLADVGKPYDAALDAHYLSLPCVCSNFMAFSAPSRSNVGSTSSDAPMLATIASSSAGVARCST